MSDFMRMEELIDTGESFECLWYFFFCKVHNGEGSWSILSPTCKLVTEDHRSAKNALTADIAF